MRNFNDNSGHVSHVGLMVYRIDLNSQLDILTLARRLGVSAASFSKAADPLAVEVRLHNKEQRAFWRGVHCNQDSIYDVRFVGVERVEQISFPASHVGPRVTEHQLTLSRDTVMIEGVIASRLRLHDESMDAQILVAPADQFNISGHSKIVPSWVETLVGDHIEYEFVVLEWRLRLAACGVVAHGHAFIAKPAGVQEYMKEGNNAASEGIAA